jgi:predicted ribosomally synthesized peptide with nif11-like leader
MSKADLDRFVADLKTKKDLQAAVAKGAGGLQSALAVAKSHGYNITIDEARTYMREKAANLSDKELDMLAGGKGSSPAPKPKPAPAGGQNITSTVNVQTTTNVTTVVTGAELEVVAGEAVGVGTTVIVVAEGAVILT